MKVFHAERDPLSSAHRTDKEDAQQGKILDYCVLKTAEGIRRWASRGKMRKLQTTMLSIQPPKDTASPINLPHYHRNRPSAPKDRRRWGNRMGEWVVGSRPKTGGGCSTEGRNKSEE